MSEPAKPCVPAHVAIIMDGNGRWASERGLPRTAGHKRGIDAVRGAVAAAREIGIKYLTVYSFSTENWLRPKAEVTFLLDLLHRFIRQDVAELHKADVRILIIGEREGLDQVTNTMLDETERMTASNQGLTLLVAFNYGSKQEIARAFRKIAFDIQSGRISPADITPELISNHLDTREIPEPDLLIRTGGEQRISNFLLWQCAYTEFVFIDEHWPEFSKEILERCINEFQSRDRRFGAVKVSTA